MSTSSVTPAPGASTTPRLGRVLRAFAYPRRASDFVGLLIPRLARIDAAGSRVPATVVAVTDEAADTRTLTLRMGRGWHGHRAGQFVTIYANIDGIWQPRCYSISSSDTTRRTIAITVRATVDGFVSRYLVERAAVGESMQISQAAGEFVLPDDDTPRLFITAGSGITPVMGMLASGAAERADCVHLHYARTPDDVIFGAELRQRDQDQPGYRWHELHTADGGERFSAGQLDRLCPDWRERSVWVCGPAPLLDAVYAHWDAAGLAERMRVERFRPAAIIRDNDAGGGRAEFAASGRVVDANGQDPLLVVAESADLHPAYGCRMGICHTCDCTLIAGAVRDLRTGRITDTPGVRIQPCINAAAGDVTLEL